MSRAIPGAEIIVDGVAAKPGRPSIVATVAEHLVIGIPGNPVAAMVVRQNTSATLNFAEILVHAMRYQAIQRNRNVCREAYEGPPKRQQHRLAH